MRRGSPSPSSAPLNAPGFGRFRTDTLVAAHRAGAKRAGDEALAASDDAGLVEACGGSVVVVAGDERAMKVTTPMDLALAELLVKQ